MLVGLLGLALTACGAGSGSGDSPDNTSDGFAATTEASPFANTTTDSGVCSVSAQRHWVEDAMRDYYLFYDQVPTVRLEDYATAEALIEDLRIPTDRFSYVGEADLNEAFFEEGETIGYGWRLRRRADGALAIALVEPLSPLAEAGVTRGELLRTIDGTSTDSITTNQQAIDLLGTGSDERTVTLGIEASDGSLRQVTVTRSTYPVQAVLDTRVVTQGALRIGYLSFLTFVETARAELDAAFAELASANIDELVIDLRFNGGGRIDVANELASRVIGRGGDNRDFLRIQYNDRYQPLFDPDTLRQSFYSLPDSLDLSRVYILTQSGTCSASELVINGLAPHIDVVTIGAATCGKPYGTLGRTLHEDCNKVIHAVEVEFKNEAGVGGYIDGLPPTCAATDTLTAPLGDPNESLFQAALQHIDQGSCDTSFADTLASRRAARNNGSFNPVNPHGAGFPLP